MTMVEIVIAGRKRKQWNRWPW